MRAKFFTLLICVLFFVNFSYAQQNKQWGSVQALEHARAYNDPTSWDLEQLTLEVGYVEVLLSIDFPLSNTPFPTPQYDSPGNGNKSIKLTWGDKPLCGYAAMIAKGEGTEYLFKDPGQEEAYFFTLISLAANEDQEAISSSRNHPHYLFQGSLNRNEKSQVDFVAFQAANGDAYATINGRLFELSAGRVILAAPQKDGSIRFHQLNVGLMDKVSHEAYLEDLMSLEEVTSFWEQEGNI